MQVIPVIDVRHGVAVRAVAGDRANYQPLVSPITTSPDPADVARGLIALHAFPVIYIADLDGIEGRGADLTLPQRVREAVGDSLEIWLDRGARPGDGLANVVKSDGVESHGAGPNVRDVLGTESGWDAEALAGLPARMRAQAILSLDFRRDGFVGDAAVLERPEVWPSRVIVMTLGRVGNQGGPDVETIARVMAVASRGAQSPMIFAAGGVRNRTDLAELAHIGVTGALISTALHAQTITAADLG